MGMTILGGPRYPYEEEVGGAAAGGGGGDAAAAAAAAAAAKGPNAADARKFVADFVPDPKALEGMKDEDVLAYHGRLSTTLDKVRPKQAGTWPEKWREEFSAGDEKLLARFGRYQSPKDVAAALVAAQNRISSGELRSALPKDASEEQVKVWRKENGIPDEAAGYWQQIKLKDGLVVGDEDKPVIETFLKTAHGANMDARAVSAAIDWYYDELDRQTEERAKADLDAARKVSDELHGEWGTEFRQNMNLYNSFLDSMPAELKEGLLRGRLADGTPVGSSAGVIKWLTLKARELNPAGIFLADGGGSVATSIDDEIKRIEGWMGAPQGSPDYKKYWDDVKTQERLRVLYSAREKAQGQPRAGG